MGDEAEQPLLNGHRAPSQDGRLDQVEVDVNAVIDGDGQHRNSLDGSVVAPER